MAKKAISRRNRKEATDSLVVVPDRVSEVDNTPRYIILYASGTANTAAAVER
jgi:hypothetical protein